MDSGLLECLVALSGGSIQSWDFTLVDGFTAPTEQALAPLRRAYYRLQPWERHARCLELRSQHPENFRNACKIWLKAGRGVTTRFLRCCCYQPDLWPLMKPRLGAVNQGFAEEFSQADPEFLLQLPKELFEWLLEPLSHGLWLDGGWTRELQAALQKTPLRTIKLQVAMLSNRGEEVAGLLGAEQKRQGYAAAWDFLRGDPQSAYLGFQKLIARRRPELRVFSGWVALFARLTALAQGDMGLLMDARLRGYGATDELLDCAAKPGRLQPGKPGLLACVAWSLRHRLQCEVVLPEGCWEHLRAQGFELLVEPRWVPTGNQEEPWQTFLRLLEAQADLGPKPAVSGKKSGALNWHLFPPEIVFYQDKTRSLEEEPPEHLQGKPLSSKTLLSRLPDYLTEADRVALAKVRLSSYGGAHLSVDALRALVGHPRVYWRERRKTLTEKVQRLRLERSGRGFRLVLSPRFEEGRDYLIEAEEGQPELVFWTRSPLEGQLLTLLQQQGEIPLAAEAQLRQVLSRWVTRIEVECGPGVPPLQHDRVKADLLHLRARPTARGLRFDWVVRCPGVASFCRAAGDGLELERVTEEGQVMLVERNLEEEEQRLEALWQQWPSLPPSTAFRLDSVVDILELLEECRQAEITLEWPEGQAWRVRRGQKLSLNARAESQDWFALEGSLELDEGARLELSAALAAARLGTGPFLELGENDYVRIDEELRQQLQSLADLADPASARLPALAVPSLAALELGGLSHDQAFLDRLEQFEEASRYAPAVPRRLQAELRDYQLEGFRWLARHARMGTGACLADDMGLGKTLQVIALMLHHRADGPHLVVCPVSVVGQWADQLQQFAPSLRPILYEGKERELKKLSNGDVVICSYGVLLRDAKKLTGAGWMVAVLDEAQAIKNPQSKTARCAYQLEARMRVTTTGTPIENRLSELWSLFAFLNPGLLGSLADFRKRYEDGGPQRSRLRALVAPFLLRRLKSQVLSELPPRTEITLSLGLDVRERALYEELRANAQRDLEEGQALDLLAHLTRLRQACCHPGLLLESHEGSSSKLDALLALLEDLQAGNHRALVFSQFTRFLDLVEKQLKARSWAYLRLDGSTTATERRRRVEAFQGGEGEVFLISLKAGGTGLNLTGADYVVHLDPWWNPAAEDQASDRAHRIGQQRPVTVYRLISEQTIEEKVVRLHGHKRQLAESVLEGRDQVVTLNTEELRDLVRLA